MSQSHPGWVKRTFWYFCSAQSSVFVQATPTVIVAESYPSVSMSFTGHVLMAVLWVAAVAAYATFVSYQFFTAPDKVTFQHSPADAQPPAYVEVRAWCSAPPRCGNITITADFSATTQCRQLTPQFFSVDSTASGWDQSVAVKVPLCYTGEQVFSIANDNPLPPALGVIVDFRSVNPGYTAAGVPSGVAAQGVVSVRDPNGGSEKLMVLESWQVKKAVMGQTASYKYGTLTSQSAYPQVTQYEGRRPTRRATAIISLAAYADVTTTIKRAADLTLFGFMGHCGVMCGMAFFMNSINVFLIPLFTRFFPGPSEIARLEKERAAKDDKVELLEQLQKDDDVVKKPKPASHEL